VEQHPDDAVVVVTVRHRASFRVRLIAFGTDAMLLGPAELVEDLVAWLAPIARGATGTSGAA
jgi:hypothetical protein